MREVFDVAIVGAGPSGSFLGFELQRQGLHCLLIDKANPPRYKTCGGGVTARVTPLLPFHISEVSEQSCYEVELGIDCLENRKAFRVESSDPLVHMVMRDRFDFKILQAAIDAGLCFYPHTHLKSLARQSGVWRLKSEHREFFSQLIVGADGANSFVAKTLGFRGDQQMAPALEYEVWVGPDDLNRFRNRLIIDFDVSPKAYAWVFPKREHLSIGVGRLLPGDEDLNLAYQAYLKSLKLREVIRFERHGYMVPLRPRKFFARGGAFLVGDAAGLADPLTAEGIGNAVLSSKLLAEAIVNSRSVRIQFDIPRIEKDYSMKLEAEILPQIRRARRLAHFVYRFPKLRNVLFRFWGQRLTEAFCPIVAGLRSYPSLARIASWLSKQIGSSLVVPIRRARP